MDRSEIFDKIAEVAADVLGVDVADISDETTFDDLDADSLERLQLVTAIKTYLQSLARDGLIEADFTVDIDLDSQRAWLESQGTPTVDMSDQQVRQANTGSQVFLVLTVKPVDAMEDVQIIVEV